MELNAETRRKLREMGASDLLEALAAQDEEVCVGMSCAERIQMAVDEAHSNFVTQKVANLVKRAKLRYPEADVRSLDFDERRGLDRILISELATCGYATRGTNIVLQGLTGTGKSHLACALAKEACRQRIRAHYVRMPELEEKWRESLERAGAERKLVQKLAAFTVLVLDEWLLDEPDAGFCSMILELMEARYGTGSTIFCTQYRKKDWHARLGADVRADAVMDRIVHNTIWVDMGDFNMREKLGGRTAS